FPVPPSVDWREKGALVPIKNQGRCGSCWAFSAVASVEALNKIKGGELISLSEQMMVDCVNASYGCKGGRQTDAFKYIKVHGIASSKDYPYVGVQGPCQPKEIVLKISGYRGIVRNNEKYLQIIASQQVVSISIKVGKDFQHYKSGIFNGTCGDKINHGVNVVGYGSENGIPYWIVRNSWGKGWGEQGYIRMRRNTSNPAGCCGVAITPTFPVID
uniref:Procerain n=1 Tax=Calotropis gigantea TaxID=4066 RepID=UPI00383BF722